jgi:hypothetical protein
MDELLYLDVSVDGAAAETRRGRESPGWNDIESAIEEVFRCGGCVRLEHVARAGERTYQPIEWISMSAEPGRFQLIVSAPNNEMRVWSRGGPFVGSEHFYFHQDDLIDLRQICSDIQIAKSLFVEFFQSGGVSAPILEGTQG